MKSLYNNDIRSTNKVTNLLFFAVFLSQLFLLSCHSRKKVDDFKPMKPTGNQYWAHDAGGHWALEMDIYGDFSFYDFTNSFEIQTRQAVQATKGLIEETFCLPQKQLSRINVNSFS